MIEKKKEESPSVLALSEGVLSPPILFTNIRKLFNIINDFSFSYAFKCHIVALF